MKDLRDAASKLIGVSHVLNTKRTDRDSLADFIENKHKVLLLFRDGNADHKTFQCAINALQTAATTEIPKDISDDALKVHLSEHGYETKKEAFYLLVSNRLTEEWKRVDRLGSLLQKLRNSTP